VQVFGGDWPTPDGSGVRDYIHVMDLAEGHIAALTTLLSEAPQLLMLNLGSGKGHSVLEVIEAFAKASGRTVPYSLVARRHGDAAITVADPTQAKKRLGWETRCSLAEMCRDSWIWQSENPQGYSRC
jgi:UDP-glucose 4-epimerase